MEAEGGAGPGDIVIDYSHFGLNSFNFDGMNDQRSRDTKKLYLNYNQLASLHASVCCFANLEFLDISYNGLTALCEDVTRLTKLKELRAKNNRLDEFSLPKEFGSMQLEVLNFSGNRFEEIPLQCTKLARLQSLSLGGNRLTNIPAEIENLISLERLNLGGNFITAIPPELANLPYLNNLLLCNNRIQSVPRQFTRLQSLHSLSLRNNLLTYVPREIISLMHLHQICLSGNPLVVSFIQEMTYDPLSLLELAGRTIRNRNIAYSPSDMPPHLLHYLDLARKCPNPNCARVFTIARYWASRGLQK